MIVYPCCQRRVTRCDNQFDNLDQETFCIESKSDKLHKGIKFCMGINRKSRQYHKTDPIDEEIGIVIPGEIHGNLTKRVYYRKTFVFIKGNFQELNYNVSYKMCELYWFVRFSYGCFISSLWIHARHDLYSLFHIPILQLCFTGAIMCFHYANEETLNWVDTGLIAEFQEKQNKTKRVPCTCLTNCRYNCRYNSSGMHSIHSQTKPGSYKMAVRKGVINIKCMSWHRCRYSRNKKICYIKMSDPAPRPKMQPAQLHSSEVSKKEMPPLGLKKIREQLRSFRSAEVVQGTLMRIWYKRYHVIFNISKNSGNYVLHNTKFYKWIFRKNKRYRSSDVKWSKSLEGLSCVYLMRCNLHGRTRQRYWGKNGPHRVSWLRHQMETFFPLLALCAGISPVTSELPSQRPVTRSFDDFFDLHLNKWLSIQSRGPWFETPSRFLLRHNTVKRINENLEESDHLW